jgi:hypothetical protein
MKFSKNDLAPSRNMLKALGKGEWKLDGMEILAFAEMMKWFSIIQRTIESEVADLEMQEKMRAEEQKKLAEGKIEPKPLEDPIKPLDGASPRVAKTKSKK